MPRDSILANLQLPSFYLAILACLLGVFNLIRKLWVVCLPPPVTCLRNKTVFRLSYCTLVQSSSPHGNQMPKDSILANLQVPPFYLAILACLLEVFKVIRKLWTGCLPPQITCLRNKTVFRLSYYALVQSSSSSTHGIQMPKDSILANL